MKETVIDLGSSTITLNNNCRCYTVEYEGGKTWICSPTLEQAKKYYDDMVQFTTDDNWRKEIDYRETVRCEKDPNPGFCRVWDNGLPLVRIYEIIADFPNDTVDIIATTEY